MNNLPRYATIEKCVGETPLEATERLRAELQLDRTIPLSYAGRLDPMASGKLLVLIGDECKNQVLYHRLDKEYVFDVLFDIRSDTGDVLGLVELCNRTHISERVIRTVTDELVGNISMPYPHFSAKTVRGKPLHEWTLENRLGEIEIPLQHSRIYKLTLQKLETTSKSVLLEAVSKKIETIPPVTDPRKALGADFRRTDVRASWQNVAEAEGQKLFQIATIRATCSSGTYMRSLAEVIAQKLGTCGLAYAISRTKIGTYLPITDRIGFWTKTF